MATYRITGTRHGAEVRSWGETSKRRACKVARDIACEYGQTFDDVYVIDAGGRVVYHLHRFPEGDGMCWGKRATTGRVAHHYVAHSIAQREEGS